MKAFFTRFFFLGILFLYNPFVFAAQVSSPGIGGLAEEVVEGPMTVLLNVMVMICYFVGVLLIVGGVSKYFLHRKSPQMAPLSTVIVYFILGILAILLPLTLRLMSVPINLNIF